MKEYAYIIPSWRNQSPLPTDWESAGDGIISLTRQ